MAKKYVDPSLVDEMAKLDDGANETAEFLNAQAVSAAASTDPKIATEKPAESPAQRKIRLAQEKLDKALEAQRKADEKAKKADEPKTPRATKPAQNVQPFELLPLEATDTYVDFQGVSHKVAYVTLDQLIPLDETPLKGAKQVMRKINGQHVENLTLAYENGAKVPPIKVRNSSLGIIPFDGYHRWTSLETMLANHVDVDQLNEARSKVTLPVEPDNSLNTRELLKASGMANLTNGLPVTRDSRSMFAIWLLQDAHDNGDKLTVLDAARIAGVSRVAVHRMMQRIAERTTDQKTVDDLFLDESEKEEYVQDSIKEDKTVKADALLSSSKAFFNSIKKMTGELERADQLVKYWKTHSFIDGVNLEGMETAAIALQEYVDSLR